MHGEGEAVPADLCFWDADHEQVKGCAARCDCSHENRPPYYGDTVVICKDSNANFREISYEIVITNYNTISVKIKVCKVSVNPPRCTERTEKVSRYFAFGNDSPVPGTGNVHGRLYQAGTYEISVLFTGTNFPEKPNDKEYWYTAIYEYKVIQLPKCDGSQNITLY